MNYGQIGFGQVNGYPPACWMYAGVSGSSVRLEHVSRGGQVPFPPQFTSAEEAERICQRYSDDDIREYVFPSPEVQANG